MANTYACKNAINISKPVNATINTRGSTPVKNGITTTKPAKMPQLNPEFFVSQLFWLVVTFSFLLVFLWRVSLPRIGNILEKRERKINEDLTAAKELQSEAENIQDKIEQQLKQARSDASELIKSSSTSFQDNAQIEISKLEKELDEKINDSSIKIENIKNESLNLIQSQINEITKLTLSKVTSFEVTDDEIKNTVKNTEGSLN